MFFKKRELSKENLQISPEASIVFLLNFTIFIVIILELTTKETVSNLPRKRNFQIKFANLSQKSLKAFLNKFEDFLSYCISINYLNNM